MASQRSPNWFLCELSARKHLLALAFAALAVLNSVSAGAQASRVASAGPATVATAALPVGSDAVAPPSTEDSPPDLARTTVDAVPVPVKSVGPSNTPVNAQATRETPDATPRLFVRDGQFYNKPFEVFVDQQLPANSRPALELRSIHDSGTHPEQLPKLSFFAPNQMRTIVVDGRSIAVRGTLLVFELDHHLPFYNAALRVRPVIRWSNAAMASDASMVGGPRRNVVAPQLSIAVCEREVLLGNFLGALLWTVVTLVGLVLLLGKCTISLSRQIQSFHVRPGLLLLTGPSGNLSLSQAQVVAWTVVIGSLVFMFGLMRLAVPEIPESLVALMGMSLLTGVVGKSRVGLSSDGYRSSEPPPPTARPTNEPNPSAPPAGRQATDPLPGTNQPKIRARCADLVSTWDLATGEPSLSLPKAQMVFWTVIVILLFIVKTVSRGTLWDVPWEMVALTGFSQVGYLGDKYVASLPGRHGRK